MRELSFDQSSMVVGGDEEASGTCESVGNVAGAVAGVGGAALGALTRTQVGIAGGGAAGFEIGSTAGEGACNAISESVDGMLNSFNAFLNAAMHGPVNLNVDWY